MNIFKDAEGFIGKIDSDKITGETPQLWRLAKELRSRLGNKAYLLDSFLSCLLEGINISQASCMSEDGFMYGCSLRDLCAAALDGNESGETFAHPLYKTVKQYIDGHPLPYQERLTKLNIYYAIMADELLRDSVADFLEERHAVLGMAFDTVRVRHLYYELIVLLKESDSIEMLNNLIRSRFQIANAASVFLQALNNEFLYALTFRDEETNKQVFQLLLDGEW